MSFIYRLKDNLSLIPNDEHFDFSYLPVKRNVKPWKLSSFGIYIKNREGEGIFGLGTILDENYYNSSLVLRCFYF
jgi:hypothetical protein